MSHYLNAQSLASGRHPLLVEDAEQHRLMREALAGGFHDRKPRAWRWRRRAASG